MILMFSFTPSFYPIGAPVPRRKTRAFFSRATFTATSTELSLAQCPYASSSAIRWVILSEHRRANAGERLASRIRWVNLSGQMWVNFAERHSSSHADEQVRKRTISAFGRGFWTE
jgi:hypothetical protein